MQPLESFWVFLAVKLCIAAPHSSSHHNAPRFEELWREQDEFVFVVQDMFNTLECDHLMSQAKLGDFKPARIGDDELDEERRNASYAILNFGYWKDKTIQGIADRLESFVKIPQRNWEAMQVNHYGAGNHYSWHHDVRGRRKVSVILFLNDVPEEAQGSTVLATDTENPTGSTRIQIQPTRGTALVFSSHIQHAGLKLLQGEKWIINQWIHDKPMDPGQYYFGALLRNHHTAQRLFLNWYPRLSPVLGFILYFLALALFSFGFAALIKRCRCNSAEDAARVKAERPIKPRHLPHLRLKSDRCRPEKKGIKVLEQVQRSATDPQPELDPLKRL